MGRGFEAGNAGGSGGNGVAPGPEGWPSGLRRTLGKRVYGIPYRGFESHSLRQSDLGKLFSALAERQKKPLFQRGLLGEPGTAPLPKPVFFFSYGPFSLKAGYCAILVPSLGFQ